jgi:hypothetical protein
VAFLDLAANEYSLGLGYVYTMINIGNFVERPNTARCALNRVLDKVSIVRFGILTAMLLKIQVLWDFMQCRMVVSYVSKKCLHSSSG